MARRPIVIQTVLPLTPEAAFAYVADPLHDPQWCKAVPWCRHETGVPMEVGAVYAFAEGWDRTKPTDEGTVTIEAVEPPHRIAYRARTRERDYAISYRFEATTGGTRVTQRTVPAFKGKVDRLMWLLRPVIKMQYRRQFRDLRTVTDGGTPKWRREDASELP